MLNACSHLRPDPAQPLAQLTQALVIELASYRAFNQRLKERLAALKERTDG